MGARQSGQSWRPLPHINQPDGFPVLLDEHLAEPGPFRSIELRVVLHDLLGVAPGELEQLRVLRDPCDPKWRQAVLARAEEVAHPADLQVGLGDAETVGRLADGFHAPGGLFRLRLGDEDAEALFAPRAAPDAPAELVELG